MVQTSQFRAQLHKRQKRLNGKKANAFGPLHPNPGGANAHDCLLTAIKQKMKTKLVRQNTQRRTAVCSSDKQEETVERRDPPTCQFCFQKAAGCES